MFYTEQYIKELRKKLQNLKSGKAVAIAAQDTHVKVVERIFDKGRNAQDGEIGQYDTSAPLYVNPKYSPKKFPKKGKSGKAKFKNGRARKTGFFQSYKDFKQAIGRPTAFVNLKLSGLLQSDFGKGVQRVSPLRHIAAVRNINSDKIKGLEDKYGNIFRLTPKERTHYKQVLAYESNKIMS